MQLKVSKTINVAIHKKDKPPLFEAFKAVGFNSKNVSNTSLFYVHNAISSFDKDAKTYKDDLHENQIESLIQAEIERNAINLNREAKNAIIAKKNLTATKPQKLQKLIKEFSDKETPWQILDDTLLDHLVRNTKPPVGQPLNAYALIPAVISQFSVSRVGKGFDSYFASIDLLFILDS